MNLTSASPVFLEAPTSDPHLYKYIYIYIYIGPADGPRGGGKPAEGPRGGGRPPRGLGGGGEGGGGGPETVSLIND